MNNSTLTYDEFIRSEIRKWDEEYVISLIDAGFSAILTTAGWKWIQDVKEVSLDVGLRKRQVAA